ncbi:MAG: alpha/beta hydrolase [Planctomycetota bacterium]
MRKLSAILLLLWIGACAAPQLEPVSGVGACMAPPPEPVPPQLVEHVYASPDGVPLKAHVFSAPAEKPSGLKRPAIVLFHGGGWEMGEAEWAFPRAKRFAERGMVAVAAQYRLSDQKEITPLEAMADARVVIRWMRAEADTLGIDPARIAACGWSAGGHLAVSAAIFGEGDSVEDASARPNALVLVSPAVSLASDGWVQRLLGSRGKARDISPDEHVRAGLPPTLILQGSADSVTPLSGAERFCERMRAAGNRCELYVYRGFGHLFTPAGIPDDGMPQPDPSISADASARADRFLESLGFLKQP